MLSKDDFEEAVARVEKSLGDAEKDLTALLQRLATYDRCVTLERQSVYFLIWCFILFCLICYVPYER